MKAYTKLLSILLVIAMCFSFAVITASADGDIPDEAQSEENQKQDSPAEEKSSDEEKSDGSQSADLIVNGAVVSASDSASGSGDKTVSSANGIAKIDVGEETRYYATIADALEEAEKGQKIVLVAGEAHILLNAPLTIPEGVSLNLNGRTLVFVPTQNEEFAIFLNDKAQVKNGEIKVKTKVTEEETFSFAVAVDGEGVVFLDEVWASNEGGNIRSGAAAAYNLEATETDSSVFKFVKPVVEDDDTDKDEEKGSEKGSEEGSEEKGSEEPVGQEPEEEPAEKDNEEPEEEPAKEDGEEDGEEKDSEGDKDEEIVVEQKPDIVADEPDNTVIQSDNHAYESLSGMVADGCTEDTWLVHEMTWNITDFGSITSMFIDQCNYPINGNITVPSGKSLKLKNGTVNGNITVNGTLTLDNVQVNGTVTLASAGTQAILNAGSGSAANAVVIDASAGTVSPNISDGTYGSISFTGSASNVVGGVTGGLYKNAVPVEICAKGRKPAASKNTDYPYTVASEPASVKNVSGKTSVDYFKGQPSKNVNLTFAVTPGLSTLSVKNASSKATVATLANGTDYNYYAAGGRVEISKFASFLENLPADALVLAFDMDNGGYVEYPLNVWANVTFTPSRYYKGSGTSIVFDVTDLPLEIVMDTTDESAGTKLVSGTDYTVSGNKITLPASFLESLDGGSHNFFFKYMLGSQSYRLRCTVAVLVDYRVFKINDVSVVDANTATVDWYTNSGKTLTFYAEGAYELFTGVKVGDKTLAAGNYTVRKGENGTIVSLNPGFLNTLAKGNYPVTILFKDGEATAQFDVHIGSASPKTGDESNLVLWAAVMLLSGSAVVALVPRKKKQ